MGAGLLPFAARWAAGVDGARPPLFVGVMNVGVWAGAGCVNVVPHHGTAGDAGAGAAGAGACCVNRVDVGAGCCCVKRVEVGAGAGAVVVSQLGVVGAGAGAGAVVKSGVAAGVAAGAAGVVSQLVAAGGVVVEAGAGAGASPSSDAKRLTVGAGTGAGADGNVGSGVVVGDGALLVAGAVVDAGVGVAILRRVCETSCTPRASHASHRSTMHCTHWNRKPQKSLAPQPLQVTLVCRIVARFCAIGHAATAAALAASMRTKRWLASCVRTAGSMQFWHRS